MKRATKNEPASNGKYSLQQKRDAVTLLQGGHTFEAIAKKTGITLGTLKSQTYVWRKDPHVFGGIRANVANVSKKLEKISEKPVENKTEPPPKRLSNIRMAMEELRQKLDSLQSDLEKLEQSVREALDLYDEAEEGISEHENNLLKAMT